MKSLNLKTVLSVLFFACIAFTSCKKNDVPPPVPVIEGSWVGKYGAGNNVPDNYYAFNILAGGKLQIKNSDNVVIGSGTWTLDDVTFKGVYTYTGTTETYNLAAKFDDKAETLFGSWGEGQVSAGDGEFYLEKQ